MKRMFRSFALVVVLAVASCAVATPLYAQVPDSLFPARPTNFVTDAAGLLDPAAEARLDSIALGVQQHLGGDIAVVTLPDIGDYEPYEVALQIGRTWGVGGKAAIGSEQRNLGVVVLVVPKTSAHRGQCYIATGNGAEGFITDADAGDMCRDAISDFKQNDYAGGIGVLVQDVAKAMDETIHPPPPPPPFDWTPVWWTLLYTVLVLLIASIPYLRWRKAKLARERAERERYEREQREYWAAQDAKRAERRREAEAARKEAERLEAIRWAALTPEQQAAETAAREEMERAAAAMRKQREEEEAERRRRESSYSSYHSYGGGSSSDSGSSSGGDFGGFGGGGGFSGGGGGGSW